MRSRYAAYAVSQVSYLIRTTAGGSPHWEANEAQWRASLTEYCREVEFLGLSVGDVDIDEAGTTAWVSFRATLQRGDEDVSFDERSRFTRLIKQWRYMAAEP